MAVKFYFRKDRYGLEEIELKRLTLIHGGTFRQWREILVSICDLDTLHLFLNLSLFPNIPTGVYGS